MDVPEGAVACLQPDAFGCRYRNYGEEIMVGNQGASDSAYTQGTGMSSTWAIGTMVRDPSANGPSIAIVPAQEAPMSSEDSCKARFHSLAFDRRTPDADIALAEEAAANASMGSSGPPTLAAEWAIRNLTDQGLIRSNRSAGSGDSGSAPATQAQYAAALAALATASLRPDGLPRNANRTERCGRPARMESHRLVFFRDDPGVATDRTNRLMMYRGQERTAWAGGAGWDSDIQGWYRRYYAKFGTPRFVAGSTISAVDVPSGTAE